MRRLAVVASPLLAIALFGCGSSNDNKNNNQAPAQAAPAGQTINVGETEYKLDPSDPKVAKTGTVTVKVTNNGTIVHSLEVEGPKAEARLGKKLQPGQSGTLKVDLSKAGKYEWYCPIDGHKGLGMKGEIAVAGGKSSSSGSSSSGSSSSGGGGY
jgi:uncharacterized cupredoxin-like copper-binding protein